MLTIQAQRALRRASMTIKKFHQETVAVGEEHAGNSDRPVNPG
jgi:hypothetical protein